MTRPQYNQHQEQMAVYRAEFALVWSEGCQVSQAQLSGRALAMAELSAWTKWYADRIADKQQEAAHQ